MDWSIYVKTTRKRLHLTQTEFAKILGVSLPAVQSWEYSRSKPLPLQQDLIQRIDAYLNKQDTKQRQEEFVSQVKMMAIGAGVAFGLYQLLKLLFQDEKKS